MAEEEEGEENMKKKKMKEFSETEISVSIRKENRLG